MRKQHTNILVSVTVLFMVYLAGFYSGRNWSHGTVQISHVVSARESVVSAEPVPVSLTAATEAPPPETQAIPETQVFSETQPIPEATEQVLAAAATSASSETAEPATEAIAPTQASIQPEQTQATESTSGLININTASAATLETLPGIGEVLAQRIVEYRQTYGPFQSVYALTNVKGIGEKRLAAIINLITV